MKSIIQNNKKCYVCGSELDLHCHHVFGGRNRKKSEKHGMKVWLCGRHHNMSDHGVHFNRGLDLALKQDAQRLFERKYSHSFFMREFGRNYI